MSDAAQINQDLTLITCNCTLAVDLQDNMTVSLDS